jgi:hypothetical protein
MSPIEQRLLSECRQIADEALHNYDKAELIDEIWTAEDRERLAKAYFDEAHWALSHVKNARYDTRNGTWVQTRWNNTRLVPAACRGRDDLSVPQQKWTNESGWVDLWAPPRGT